MTRAPAEYFSYDEAHKHKSLHRGPWSRAIWVDDAGENEIAVIHWMGGGYKVVGRYTADAADAAKEHAARCSAYGYCPTTFADPRPLTTEEAEAKRRVIDGRDLGEPV